MSENTPQQLSRIATTTATEDDGNGNEMFIELSA